MARYAAMTRVSIQQTRVDIERILTKYGATSFAYMSQSFPTNRAIVAFEAGGRHIKIILTLPQGDGPKEQQLARQRWRALLLVIKAKLASVESKIETLEEAFYANIVMPDGRTIYEATHKEVATAYELGNVTALLPDYSGSRKRKPTDAQS